MSEKAKRRKRDPCWYNDLSGRWVDTRPRMVIGAIWILCAAPTALNNTCLLVLLSPMCLRAIAVSRDNVTINGRQHPTQPANARSSQSGIPVQNDQEFRFCS